MRNGTGSRFEVGSAERLRLLGFVLLWLLLWGVALTQVVAPLGHLGIRGTQVPSPIEQGIRG